MPDCWGREDVLELVRRFLLLPFANKISAARAAGIVVRVPSTSMAERLITRCVSMKLSALSVAVDQEVEQISMAHEAIVAAAQEHNQRDLERGTGW